MSENATARELAQYIKDRENVILRFSLTDDCDIISQQILFETIVEFYEEISKF